MIIFGRRVSSALLLVLWLVAFYHMWQDICLVEPRDHRALDLSWWHLASYFTVIAALSCIVCTIGAKVHCLMTREAPGRWHIWSLKSFTFFIVLAYTIVWAIPDNLVPGPPIFLGLSGMILMFALTGNVIYDAIDLLQDRLRRLSLFATADELDRNLKIVGH